MNTRTTGLITLILLASALIYLRYEPYFQHPNTSYYHIYGDSFKNYATILYHVKHDSTYLHYGGMNYPYGEHVMFTDGQPIVANTVKWISRNIVDISDHTLAIINLLPLFSLLISSILLYLIFTRLKLPGWYSIAVTLGLIMLSPQTARLIGHYSLSYTFVLPAILYFLLRFEEKPHWKWSVFTGILLITSALLHFYFLAIGGMLIAFYFLFHLLRDFTWKKVGQLALHFSIQAVIPFILLQLWLHWSDPVDDRPAIPMGFLDYHAYWEGIVTSVKIPYWAWIDRQIVDIRDMNFESEAYIGLVSVIYFLVLFIYWVRRRFKKPFLIHADHDFLKNLFPAAFVILLLSLGLPFSIPGLDFLADYVGPYRQFRGQGRFAWVFYYSWNIIVWYGLYHYIQKLQTRWKKILLYSISLFLLYFEAYHYAVKETPAPWRDITLQKEKFEASEGYWFKNIDLSRYQAVLPIPYHHVGSENLQEEYPGDLLRLGLIPGLHYGLPSMGVWMSRTSFSQTLKMVPIALLPYRSYRFLENMPNEKPLLVVVDKAQFGASKRNYGYLLRYAKPLFENELLLLYELELNAFNKGVEAWRQDVMNGWEWSREHYVQKDGFWLPDSSQQVLHMSFDSLYSSRIYQGKGALEVPVKKRVFVFEKTLPATQNTCEIWVYMGEDQYPRINFKAWEIDENGNENWIMHIGARFDLIALDHNGWGLVQFPLNVSNVKNRVRFELECKEIQHPTVFIDELLIRPSGVNVFWQKDDWLVYNNLWFK